MAATDASPFQWQRWIGPVLIGSAAALGIGWWGLQQEVIDPVTQQPVSSLQLLRAFQWNSRTLFASLGLLGCVLLRDLGYMYRLRILSNGSMRWRQCFDSIVLWELSSALTPSVVGGSAAAVWILKREGMRWGKSLATVFATALMDELFYLIAVPVMFGIAAISGHPVFPEFNSAMPELVASVPVLFGLAYAVIAALTSIIIYALIIRPESTFRWITSCGNSRIFRHWKQSIDAWASDLREASKTLKIAKPAFWSRAFLATCVSWSARFLTLNMIFLIFYSSVPHAALLARQLVLWLLLMISPTPGSAGAAELGLPALTSDLMGIAYLAIVVLIWRLATYFLYLILGALVLPQWLLKTRNS